MFSGRFARRPWMNVAGAFDLNRAGGSIGWTRPLTGVVRTGPACTRRDGMLSAMPSSRRGRYIRAVTLRCSMHRATDHEPGAGCQVNSFCERGDERVGSQKGARTAVGTHRSQGEGASGPEAATPPLQRA